MHVNCISGLLAFATSPAGSQSGQNQNPVMALLPLVLLGVVFYVIIIRPQQQRAKQQTKLLTTLKSGDEVITASGIVGTVITVKEKTVTIRSADAKFEVTKASVTEITPKDAGTTAS
jgi:preprotein translocase subunit YajC